MDVDTGGALVRMGAIFERWARNWAIVAAFEDMVLNICSVQFDCKRGFFLSKIQKKTPAQRWR